MIFDLIANIFKIFTAVYVVANTKNLYGELV